MIEPKFEVSITESGAFAKPLNKEGEELQDRIVSLFPKESFVKFILLTPNSMDINEDKNLVYEIDVFSIEETIEDLKRKGY